MIDRYAPAAFNWYLPLLAGLWLVDPAGAGDVQQPVAGTGCRARACFLIPAETRGLKVLDRAHALAAAYRAQAADARALVLEDARVRDLHLALLAGRASAAGPRCGCGPCASRRRARIPRAFRRDDWTLLLSDAESHPGLVGRGLRR